MGSTNAWLLAGIAEGAAAGSWVLAHRQTEGRGRRGREWVSPPGNLYLSTSLRLRPEDPPATQLAFVAALALHQALGAWVPAPRLSVKWPNDLLLDSRKLAGILLERVQDAVVIGFGANLVSHPEGVERPATSLLAAGCQPVAPQPVARALADAFAAWVATWRLEGFGRIREAWLACAHPMGTMLLARLADGEAVQGRFEAIDQDGALILRLADGAHRAIHTADVFTL